MLLNFEDGDSSLRGGLSDCRQFVTLARRHRAPEKDAFALLRGAMSERRAKALILPVTDMVCDYHEHGEYEACEFEGKNCRGKHS
jgi:hypothetical protein